MYSTPSHPETPTLTYMVIGYVARKLFNGTFHIVCGVRESVRTMLRRIGAKRVTRYDEALC